MRGGNSRHTRNLRAMHPKPTETLTDAYLEEEYFEDLLRVTKGRTDEQLARYDVKRLEPLTPDSPVAKQIEKNGGRAGFAHIAFDVTDIEAMLKHLAAFDAVPISPPYVNKTGGPNAGVRVSYLRTPDRVTIELIERRS